jgi:hypothetical protein
MESLAGILLMALAIALIIAFSNGGLKGIGTWFHAKYVGET